MTCPRARIPGGADRSKGRRAHVAETDLTGIWLAPKRKRYLAFLAGPIIDAVSASALVGFLWAHRQGWFSLSPMLTPVAGACLMVYLMRLLWECFFLSAPTSTTCSPVRSAARTSSATPRRSSAMPPPESFGHVRPSISPVALRDLGRLEEAARDLDSYLRLSPDADDRSEIDESLEHLLASG